MPKSFYGLTGNNIYFDSSSNLPNMVDQAAVDADSSADEW